MPVENHRIPQELKDWTLTLSSPLAWSIIEYFIDHEEGSYSDIYNFLKPVPRRKLNLALRKMSMYGLIRRYDTVYVGKSCITSNRKPMVAFNNIPTYKISEIGKALVNNLLKTLEPLGKIE